MKRIIAAGSLAIVLGLGITASPAHAAYDPCTDPNTLSYAHAVSPQLDRVIAAQHEMQDGSLYDVTTAEWLALYDASVEGLVVIEPLTPTPILEPFDDMRQVFYAALETAGMPRVRFHDLRHTAATLALMQGVHPKVVSDMLGHSTVGLTLDTYSHLLPAMHEQAAAAMDAILTG